ARTLVIPSSGCGVARLVVQDRKPAAIQLVDPVDAHAESGTAQRKALAVLGGPHGERTALSFEIAQEPNHPLRAPAFALMRPMPSFRVRSSENRLSGFRYAPRDE